VQIVHGIVRKAFGGMKWQTCIYALKTVTTFINVFLLNFLEKKCFIVFIKNIKQHKSF